MLTTENGRIFIAHQEFALAARDIFPDLGRKSRDVCGTAGDVGRRRQRASLSRVPWTPTLGVAHFAEGLPHSSGKAERQAGGQAGGQNAGAATLSQRRSERQLMDYQLK